jgi:hypothetical protein
VQKHPDNEPMMARLVAAPRCQSVCVRCRAAFVVRWLDAGAWEADQACQLLYEGGDNSRVVAGEGQESAQIGVGQAVPVQGSAVRIRRAQSLVAR